MVLIVSDSIFWGCFLLRHEALVVKSELEICFGKVETDRLVNGVKDDHFGDRHVGEFVNLMRIEHLRSGGEFPVDHDVRERWVELHARGDRGIRRFADFKLRFDEILDLFGKHGKIDPVGTDEIDPVKTA